MSGLTPAEVELLVNAKIANPWWWVAMLEAANVMPQRREKYSGEGDPFTNFITVNEMMRMGGRDVSMHETFMQYIFLKLARVLVTTGDYTDESFQDTLRDLANYALLDAGWHMREQAKGAFETEPPLDLKRNAT